MLKRLLPVLAVLFSSLALAATYPLTVTDDLGRRVTLAREPQRVVAVLPSHTETLFAIGAGGKLVGIDIFSNFPKAETAAIAKVGSGFQPNLEAIAALKPDLVLADESQSGRLTERLADLGLTVYGGTAQTYNETFEKIAVLGKLVNRETNALKVISSMKTDLNAIAAAVRPRPRVSAYYEVDPTPYAAGPGSFIGELLGRAGGVNILPASLGAFPKIAPELVVQANPAVIVGARLADVAGRPGWAGLRAVRENRVYTFSPEENDALSRPGPRLPVALRALVRALHPGALP